MGRCTRSPPAYSFRLAPQKPPTAGSGICDEIWYDKGPCDRLAVGHTGPRSVGGAMSVDGAVSVRGGRRPLVAPGLARLPGSSGARLHPIADAAGARESVVDALIDLVTEVLVEI